MTLSAGAAARGGITNLEPPLKYANGVTYRTKTVGRDRATQPA